jgi:hydrogenase maturation factor HypF (carbamoyltransferase family)
MAIVQEIVYNSDNTYFAGFLQNIINQSGIKGSVDFKNNIITLTLDDQDSSSLEKFSELSTKYLPHSIFLDKITTNSKDISIKDSNFTSKAYNIAPCPKCLEDLTDPSSALYLDDSLVCKHYNNENAFYDSDSTFFTPHYTDGCAVLVADASKIDQLFIMTDKEKEVLYSIEKPTIKVTIASDELKELTNKTYINIKAPYNVRSTLFALNAKDSDIPYIFFQDTSDLKVIKVQENTTIVKASRVAKELENLDEDNTINRFLNLCNDANYENVAIGANLSYTNGISFLAKTEVATKKVITFQDFILEELIQQMKDDEIRSKLLSNFSTKYEDRMRKLEESNGIDLFETLCIILDIPKPSFESLSDKALEFRGNGGLKVDIDFSDDKIDYSSIVGSVMSFILAGADTHYIAYSIFEAYGDMTISTLNQLKKTFKINNIIMMGDMFENSVLYSRILSKYQLANPFFSKQFALDD